MPRVDLDLAVAIERTARVAQIEGLFDVPEAKRQTVSFHFDAPIEQRAWQIGLIVGPSGAGKTSVARALFGDAVDVAYSWDPKRSLVDSFPADTPIRDVTTALSSVGFSSPPAWIKPFHVLSNGEQFRAKLARALVDGSPLTVVDEFTSVVDRTVAKIGTAAVSKAIRRKTGKRFVAVSCHDDIVEWLGPDWILEPHVGRFTWREQRRRPPIDLEIRRIHHSAWSLFAPHHYLSADLNTSATCFGAFWQGRLVAFDAWLPFFGKLKDERRARRGHRTVCLPDYQGVGIGRAIFDTVASMWAALGYRAFSRTAHPAEIASRQRGGLWKLGHYGFTSTSANAHGIDRTRTLNRRAASFEWIGKAMPAADARRMLEGG